MPQMVTVREDLNVIHVESYGDVTADDLRLSMEAVVKFHQNCNISKLFINATYEQSLPTTMPLFDFGAKVARVLGTLKIAVAKSPKTAEKRRFMETVIRNRGADLRIFDSKDAALKWLTE